MSTTLTQDEANAVLAEKVMGWENRAGMYFDTVDDTIVKCTYVHDWSPATNTDHALQCLEAWMDKKKSDCRWYEMSGAGHAERTYYCDLYIGQTLIIESESTADLCTAICNAILQAIDAGQLGETK